MHIHWAKFWKLPQTYLLLVGLGLGYAVLWGLAGNRWLTFLGGAVIAGAMVGSWALGFRRNPSVASDSNLLNVEAFIYHIEPLGQRVPGSGQKTWRQVEAWAAESQQFAARIAERDPLLQMELLEALHTVVDLARQVADGLAVISQIETSTYRQLAQQRLTASRDRLQATHAQLQQLQDQVALSSLEAEASQASLPQSLQILISANKLILEDPPPP
jgi:hypothetical protein